MVAPDEKTNLRKAPHVKPYVHNESVYAGRL